MTEPAPKRIPLFAIPLVAAILGIAPWALPHRSHDTAAPTEEVSPAPPVRIARETTPTIVESNANWLESNESSASAPDLQQEPKQSLLAPPDRNLQDSLQR